MSLESKSLFGRAGLIAGFTIASMAVAQPQVLIDDSFGDGDRDNDGIAEGPVTDAMDVGNPWYLSSAIPLAPDMMSPGAMISIQNDGVLGSGNALEYLAQNDATIPFIGPFPNSVTLANDGDRLSFKFKARIVESPIDVTDGGDFPTRNPDRRFRMGLYGSNDGMVAAGDQVDKTLTDDDTGFLLVLDVGFASGNSLSMFGDQADGILGGSSVSLGATDAAATSFIDNNAIEIEMILSRSGDDILAVALLNGQVVQDGIAEADVDIIPNNLPYTFDYAAFGTSGASLDYRVDDIEVVFTPAPTAPVTTDGFEDGDRDNNGAADVANGFPPGAVNDLSDTGFTWYAGSGQSDLLIDISDDSGGIGTGNALDVLSFTTSTRSVAAAIDPITLANPGDSVSFAFDFRTRTTPTSDRRFRFGLFDDGGTPITSDATGSSQDDDDIGYIVQMDTGPSTASSATIRGDLPGGILSGTTRSLGATDDSGDSSIDDTTTRRFELIVTRRSDATLGYDVNDLTLLIDGVVSTSGTDDGDDGNDAASGGPADPTAVLASTFNQIAIGTNSLQGLDFLIDNVEVVFTPFDAPGATMDGFEDGDRENDLVAEGPVNDANDIGFEWYAARGTSSFEVDIIDDSTGIGSGNALNFLSLTTATRAMTANFNETTLVANGDSISIAFDLRLNGFVPTDDRGFRFGIHNDGGTPVTTDGSSENGDELGYMAWLDLGPADGDTSTIRGDLPNGILGGTTRSTGATSDDIAFALSGNTTRSITFTVAKRFDFELGRSVNEITLDIDGITLTGVDDGDDGDDAANGGPADPNAVLAETFSQFTIGTSGVLGTDILIDNVVVTADFFDCDADINGDGILDFFDFIAYLALFDAGDMAADLSQDGMFTDADVSLYLSLFDTGCN